MQQEQLVGADGQLLAATTAAAAASASSPFSPMPYASSPAPGQGQGQGQGLPPPTFAAPAGGFGDDDDNNNDNNNNNGYDASETPISGSSNGLPALPQQDPANATDVLSQVIALVPASNNNNNNSNGTAHNSLDTVLGEEAFSYSGRRSDLALDELRIPKEKYAQNVQRLTSAGILEALGLREEDALYLLTLADASVRARINSLLASGKPPSEYVLRTLAALRKLPMVTPTPTTTTNSATSTSSSTLWVLGGAPPGDVMGAQAGARLVSTGFLMALPPALAAAAGRAASCVMEICGPAVRAPSLALFGLRAFVVEPDSVFVLEEAAKVAQSGAIVLKVRPEATSGAIVGVVGCNGGNVNNGDGGIGNSECFGMTPPVLDAAAAVLGGECANTLVFEPLRSYGPIEWTEGDYATYSAVMKRRGVHSVLDPDAWRRSCVEYNNAYYRRLARGKPMTVALSDWHSEFHSRWAAAPKALPQAPAPIEKYVAGWAPAHHCMVEDNNAASASKTENDTEVAYVLGETPLNAATATGWCIKPVSPSGTTRGYVAGVARKDAPEAGWYLSLSNLTLRSGAPHMCAGCPYGPPHPEPTSGTSVTLVFKAGALAFTVGGRPLGVAYEGIPLDEPLYPAVGLRFFEDRVTIMQEAGGSVMGKMAGLASWFRGSGTSGSASSTTERIVYAHESEYCDIVVPGAVFEFVENTFDNGVNKIKAHMLRAPSGAKWAVFLDEADEMAAKGSLVVKCRIRSVQRHVSKVKANRYSVVRNLPFYIVKVDILNKH